MIVEGLFVYLPTIIAITLAFFVGLCVGFLVVAGVCVGTGLAIWNVASLKTMVLSWLQDESVNKIAKK